MKLLKHPSSHNAIVAYISMVEKTPYNALLFMLGYI